MEFTTILIHTKTKLFKTVTETEDSNKFTTEWIHAWLVEVERIDKFFCTKRDVLIDEFILLQDKFRIKTDIHEQDRKKAEKKQKKKAAKKAKQMKQIDEIIEEEKEEEEEKSPR